MISIQDVKALDNVADIYHVSVLWVNSNVLYVEYLYYKELEVAIELS